MYNVLVCLTCTIARKFSHPSILFLAGEELIIHLISKSHLERVMTGSQALSILCRARALSLTRPCTLSTVALTLQVQRLRDRNGPATELVSRNRDEKMWKKTVTQELWEDTSSKSSSRLLFPSFLGLWEGRCYASPSEEVAALSLHTLPSQIRFEQKLGQPTGTLAPPYTPWWTRENLQTGSGPDLSLISLLLWRGSVYQAGHLPGQSQCQGTH